MESNKNNDSNGGDQHQHQQFQLRGNARKRTYNELANDVDQPADGDQQQEPENCSKKNRGGQRGNDALELENLTQEELIQLVRKQEQQAKVMTTEMEDLQMELLASQQTHLDNAKQAEEFSQRNIQLEQEKAAVQKDLHQKMGEIVKMHKEVEEKSEKLAEKAKEIDALLIQLKESTRKDHQSGLPTDEKMKIQLSLETWYDMLAFVPRRRLGQIIPMIGDRRFASIVQKFLHEYGEIMIDHIQIVATYKEDPSGHRPRVRAWQNKRPLRFEMAETQIPANIKNFKDFKLSYFDQSVLNFMKKFQQNGLLDNVNLAIAKLSAKNIVQPVLRHLLPLINGILSVYVYSTQLMDFYDAGNSKEIYERNMKMMEKTRILALDYDDPQNLHANAIDLYCRWLYQTARVDGKPRVLLIGRRNVDSRPISLFIDRLKKNFLMATDSVTFFIRIILPKYFQPKEEICLDNGTTKERLLTKMEETEWTRVLQISRFPGASTKKWIEENEKEVDLNWEFGADKIIYLINELKVVAI